LPETRGELYAEYVRRLIKSWEQQREIRLDHRGERVLTVGDLEGEAAFQAVLHGFHYLGWRLHLLYYGGKAEQEPDRDHLTEALADYLSQRHADLLREQAAKPVAEAIVDFWLEAGILDRWATEHNTFFTFRHLTFQEYAAGVRLAQAWQADPRATWRWLKPCLHLPTWREPLLLMSSKLSQSERSSLVRHLLHLRRPLLQTFYPAHNLYEGTLHRGLRLTAAVLGEEQPVEAGLAQQVVRWLGRLHRRSIWRKSDVFLPGWLGNSCTRFLRNVFAFPARLWGTQPRRWAIASGVCA